MNFFRLSNCFHLLLLLHFYITAVTAFEGSYFFYQQPEYPRDCKEVFAQCSSDNSSGVYTIKPDGYPHPFEVQCENQESGGWTVIQRRVDGSVTFNRGWDEYRKGFGFLSSEFYIGNEKLSYLTNQAVYELRIDMVLSNGSHFYIRYNSFRISDDWSQYAIVKAEGFSGNSSCVATACPIGTVHESCSCETSCTDPGTTTTCREVCVETCQPKRCYVTETDSYISNGETQVNSDCSRRCTCNDGQLNCTDYECSRYASCSVKNDERKCYCNNGQGSDDEGPCPPPVYTDCNDVQNDGQTQSGVYSIRPAGWNGSPFDVFCNMTIDGGGWTVIQRRINGATDFYKNWNDYKNGFGNIAQEFWLGNEKLYYLTQQATYEYRYDSVLSSDSARYHKYSRFRINNETNKYSVADVGSRSGDGGYTLHYTQNIAFSTKDQDNDGKSATDCAVGHRSGWWHGGRYYDYDSPNCISFPEGSRYRYCSIANPNGVYNGGNGQNVFTSNTGTDYCDTKYAEMKIRRTS